MTELLLIRHGQANVEATDEASYDRLSDLGRQQAIWLGDWLATTAMTFDRVVHGSLTRQRDTAELAFRRPAGTDARWDEISYFLLSTLYAEHHGHSEPEVSEDFADYFAGMIAVWAADALPGAPEKWSDFRARVLAALDDQAVAGGSAAIVTSGGVIGLAVASALDLGPEGMARLGVVVENTSIHRLVHLGGRWRLLEYDIELIPSDSPGEKLGDDDWDLMYRTVRMQEPLLDLWGLMLTDNKFDVDRLSGYPDWMRQELINLDYATSFKDAEARLFRIHRQIAAQAFIIPLWELDSYIALQRNIAGFAARPLSVYQDIERWLVKP